MKLSPKLLVPIAIAAATTASAADSAILMEVDATRTVGAIKPMNGVNNGPIKPGSSQTRGNFAAWKAAKIPIARNHDASFCSSYGGEHSVDVHMIFPDFSKDANDPASYDFAATDRYLATIREAGAEVYYRLGSKIEHGVRKYGTVPPPDFRKWAVICEHIIRHYNEGWANGFHWNIRYWEIWNEADCPKPTWQGTKEQFFNFYRIAATHLKAKFPHLKIGGPALADVSHIALPGQKSIWAEDFLAYMQKHQVPIDFFSWHLYASEPWYMADRAAEVRKLLDRYGYAKAENIMSEYNYLKDWTTGFMETIETIISVKGAAFTAAVMCASQCSPADCIMYYDSRPTVWNGMFDYYTYRPLKGYYPFLCWAKLADMKQKTALKITDRRVRKPEFQDIYAVAGTGENGKLGVLISCYTDAKRNDAPLSIDLAVKGMDLSGAKLFLLDEKRSLEEIPFTRNADGSFRFEAADNTVLWLEK